jgi:hypothetical protein
MKRLLPFFLLAAALPGCRPLSLYGVEPSGPPEYRIGWEDGCNSGLAAQGGVMYKMAFGFQKRPELNDNDLYKTAWNEGFTYCRATLDPVGKTSWFD